MQVCSRQQVPSMQRISHFMIGHNHSSIAGMLACAVILASFFGQSRLFDCTMADALPTWCRPQRCFKLGSTSVRSGKEYTVPLHLVDHLQVVFMFPSPMHRAQARACTSRPSCMHHQTLDPQTSAGPPGLSPCMQCRCMLPSHCCMYSCTAVCACQDRCGLVCHSSCIATRFSRHAVSTLLLSGWPSHARQALHMSSAGCCLPCWSAGLIGAIQDVSRSHTILLP